MPPLGGSSEASKTALSGSLPFKPPALPGVPDSFLPPFQLQLSKKAVPEKETAHVEG